MYRWHFDNSEIEVIVYESTLQLAKEKIRNLLGDKYADFNLVGVEEIGTNCDA